MPPSDADPQRRNTYIVLGMLAMGIVVLVSNKLVQIPVAGPLEGWLTWGAFTYPVAFLVTDVCNRGLGAAAARRVVFAGFALGVALSVAAAVDLATFEVDGFGMRIALASGTAYLCAQLLDVAVFDRLRRSPAWWRPPLFSSVIGSIVDTALFFSLAFAFSTPALPWIGWATGDLIVKLLTALALLLPFGLLTRHVPARGAA